MVSCLDPAAGIGGKGFEDIDVETCDRVLSINVRGAWLVTRTSLDADGSGDMLSRPVSSSARRPSMRRRSVMLSKLIGAPCRGARFPEDVVGAMVFLLSSGAGFVSGQLVPVNGGFIFN